MRPQLLSEAGRAPPAIGTPELTPQGSGSPPQPPPEDTYPASRPTGPTPRAQRFRPDTRPPGSHTRGRPVGYPAAQARPSPSSAGGTRLRAARAAPLRAGRGSTTAGTREERQKRAGVGVGRLRNPPRYLAPPPAAVWCSLALHRALGLRFGPVDGADPGSLRHRRSPATTPQPHRDRNGPTPETGADPGELPASRGQWETAPRPDYKFRRAPGSSLSRNYKSQRAPRAPGREATAAVAWPCFPPAGRFGAVPRTRACVKRWCEGRERRRE